MDKPIKFVNENIVNEVYNIIKEKNEKGEAIPTLWDMTYLTKSVHGYSSIQKAINILKERRLIEKKGYRLGGAIQYNIVKN